MITEPEQFDPDQYTLLIHSINQVAPLSLQLCPYITQLYLIFKKDAASFLPLHTRAKQSLL